MKKLSALVIVLVCLSGMAGCQKTLSGTDIYSFPEPTVQISGSFYSQGQEKLFVIGSTEYQTDALSAVPMAAWFYGLELTACDSPEDVDGAECYSFM